MPYFKPPWLDQIRFIGRYALSGCEAPIGLYAQMAVPTAKEIVMVFTGLSVRDIVKEFFRPKGLRSKRHGRKGRKSRGRPGGIPDPNEMIAKRLVENTEFNRRKYGMPTQIFYVIDDVIDRISWTVCLIEMSHDLIYESLLGVLEHQGHNCPNIGRLAKVGGYHVEGGAGPQWEPIGLGVTRYAIKVTSGGDGLVFVPTGTYSYTFGAKIWSPGHDMKVEWRLRAGSGPSETFETTGWVDVSDTTPIDLIINATIEGPRTIVLEAQHDGGFWDVIHSDLMVLEIV